MEIKAWNVHFFWPRGNVQPIEATQDALMKLSVALGSPTLGPELGKTLASEVPDHESM
jgi:hypothetical protein